MVKKKIGYFIIASAIIWGGVILGCSQALKGTSGYQEIRLFLYGGFISHLFFIWGPLVALFKNKKEESK